MWTSSIILFISMFSAQAAEVKQSVRDMVAQVRANQASAIAALAVAQEAPKPNEPRSTAPATLAATTELASSDIASRDLMEPTLDAPAHAFATSATFVAAAPMIKMPVPTKAQDAVAKVQNFYNTTKSFSASFSQTVKNSTFSKLKPQVSSGKVYILKPGKMRWDYKNESYRSSADPKVSKSFISDGKHLWAVMHKNKQFYKESLQGSALPVAVSFLMGTGNLLNDFNVVMETPGKFGSKSDILLLLTPKVPSARYKKLWLVVNPSNYSVKQSIVLNSKGDTNEIVFSKVTLDSGKLKPGHFIFNEKANKSYSHITPPEQ
tara:strand:+ start:33459 stop:34418 length:960 start_codon:yes stop_codon:yes gene_type:complete